MTESELLKSRIDEFSKDPEITHAFWNTHLAEIALKRFLKNYPIKTDNTKDEKWVETASYGMLTSEVEHLSTHEIYLSDLATSARVFVKPRNDFHHHLINSDKSISAIKMEFKEIIELPGQIDKGVNQILEDIDKIDNKK